MNCHEKATSQRRSAWTSSIYSNWLLIWTGTNSSIESLIKGNVNSMPESLNYLHFAVKH